MHGLRSDSGAEQPVRRRKGKARNEAVPAPETGAGGEDEGRETENFRLKFHWETCTIERGEMALQQMREEITYGAKILQRRVSAGTDAVVLCSNAQCKKPIRDGQWVARHTFRSPDTGLEYTVTSCSQRCFIVNQNAIGRGVNTHRKSGGLILG